MDVIRFNVFNYGFRWLEKNKLKHHKSFSEINGNFMCGFSQWKTLGIPQ